MNAHRNFSDASPHWLCLPQVPPSHVTVTPAAAADMATVRFGDQTGSEVDYAAVWVADFNGYYKDEGIQLERKTYANGPAALLDLNNLDAVMAAIVPYMLFAARGGEMTMVMSTTKGNAPIVGKQQYTW